MLFLTVAPTAVHRAVRGLEGRPQDKKNRQPDQTRRSEDGDRVPIRQPTVDSRGVVELVGRRLIGCRASEWAAKGTEDARPLPGPGPDSLSLLALGPPALPRCPLPVPFNPHPIPLRPPSTAAHPGTLAAGIWHPGTTAAQAPTPKITPQSPTRRPFLLLLHLWLQSSPYCLPSAKLFHIPPTEQQPLPSYFINNPSIT